MATDPEQRPSLERFLKKLKRWQQKSSTDETPLISLTPHDENYTIRRCRHYPRAFSQLGDSLQLVCEPRVWPDHQPLIDHRRIRIRFSSSLIGWRPWGSASNCTC